MENSLGFFCTKGVFLNRGCRGKQAWSPRNLPTGFVFDSILLKIIEFRFLVYWVTGPPQWAKYSPLKAKATSPGIQQGISKAVSSLVERPKPTERIHPLCSIGHSWNNCNCSEWTAFLNFCMDPYVTKNLDFRFA